MKFAIFVLFALVVIVASTPIDKKKINPAFGKCNLCQDDTNKPLCASDGGKVQLSFLNDCALKKYNCEHEQQKLTKKADKECPGSTGIRLS